PLALNPDGAYAIGVKVGRRSMDVLLVDFTGHVRERWTTSYAFPDPDAVLAEIAQRLKDIRRKLGPEKRERVQGIGIAAPLPLGVAKGNAAPAQLLSVASLFTLERVYADAGLDASAAADARALDKPWKPHTQRWLQDAAAAMALAINSAVCLLDLDGVIVDG